MVARWSLAQSGTLRIVARFGDVVIPQIRRCCPLTVRARRGAGRASRGRPEAGAIGRRDRRHPDQVRGDGRPRAARGAPGAALRSARGAPRAGAPRRRDPDGRGWADPEAARSVPRARTTRPVEVTVEAKDNDPLNGPKWGASEAITIVPPDVGEPEARRLDALRKLRDAMVDTLAWRVGNDMPAGGAERKALLADEKTAHGRRRAAPRPHAVRCLRRDPRAGAYARHAARPAAHDRERPSTPSSVPRPQGRAQMS